MVSWALLITATLAGPLRETSRWVVVGRADLACWAAVVRATRWWVGTVAVLTDEAVGAAIAIGAAARRRLAKPLCAVATGWAVCSAGASSVWLACAAYAAATVLTACLVGTVGVD